MDLLTKIENAILHANSLLALELIRSHRKRAQREIDCAVALTETEQSQDYQIEKMQGIIEALVGVIDMFVDKEVKPIKSEWDKIKKEYDL